jgi:hypothetical protein
MAMVVHVPGRHQGRHIALDEGALVREAQFGRAAGVADRIPQTAGVGLATR